MKHVLALTGLAIAGILALSGCAPSRVATTPRQQRPATSASETPEPAAPATPAQQPEASGVPWLDEVLTDAVTGTQFRLSDFRGKVVLLHPFAAW